MQLLFQKRYFELASWNDFVYIYLSLCSEVAVLGIIQIVQLFCIGVTISFTAILFWGLRSRPRVMGVGGQKVTVLIAARDEAANLPLTLLSLAQQDYPADLSEFIIIDDSSSDGTAAVVKDWQGKDDRFLLLRLEEPVQRTLGPKKRALLEGLKISQGEIILTTDADCLVPKGWITGMVSCFSERTAAVCGMIRFEKGEGFFNRLSAFEGLINAILNAAVIGAGGALSCFGANFAYRRADFIAVGGYDLGGKSLSGDDDLLLQKFCTAGKRLHFCCDPELAVQTQGPNDAKSYFARKQRHLSAGRRYAIHWIALAAIIYTGCLLTVFLALMRLSGLFESNFFLIGWALLALALITVFIKGSRGLQTSGFLIWGLLSALIFPLYFSLIHPLTLLPTPTWKGRGRG